jgi:RHS repeat-associated protein
MTIIACLMSLAMHEAQAFYSPSTGHWFSRDPIAEAGFNNLHARRARPDDKSLYAFVYNNPVSKIDLLGLRCSNPCADAERAGLRGDRLGGVICCDGQKWACAWRPGGATAISNFTASVISGLCILEHEQTHIPKETCDSCTGLSKAHFKNDHERKQSECEAYTKHFECLMRALAEGKCQGDPECVRQLELETWALETLKIENCR